MWAEYVSPETIDSRIWPRLAAIAERFWSPQSVTDVADMYRRLAVVRVRLEEHGLLHDVAQGRMLRRLAGSNDVRSIETLLQVVEPVKIYRRGSLHAMTQMTPLTRLVDTARPDADARRTISAMVDDVLRDLPVVKNYGADYAPPLARTFTEWRDLRPAFDIVADQSPIVREASPLAADLSEIGVSGLEALSYLTQRVAPPSGWRESKLSLLERAAKPRAEVEFIMLPAMKKLFIAAAEVEQLKNMTPDEWNKRVSEMSAPPAVKAEN
jgi:hexosaminidase